jgi:nucleoid DNA-binding protein
MKLVLIYKLMNKTDIIDVVAKKAGMTKVAVAETLDAFQESIMEALAKGTNVTMTGFVTFKVKHRAARSGRNPQTGKPIQIPASHVVTFSAGKTLKEFVKNSKHLKKSK